MKAPLCPRCGAPKIVRVRDGGPGRLARILYCPCSGRQSSAAWIKRNPRKRAAHKAVERAIRRGEMQRQPCARCGEADAEAHHEDYAAPLDVQWLCRKHHAEQHKRTDLCL